MATSFRRPWTMASVRASPNGSSWGSLSCWKVSLNFCWETMLLNDRFLPTGVNSARNSGLPPRCSKRRKAESRASSSSFTKAIKNTNKRPVLTLGCFHSLRFYFCVLLDNLRSVTPDSSFYFISLNLYKRELFTRESLRSVTPGSSVYLVDLNERSAFTRDSSRSVTPGSSVYFLTILLCCCRFGYTPTLPSSTYFPFLNDRHVKS